MKHEIFIPLCLAICLTVLFMGCSGDAPVSPSGPQEVFEVGTVTGTITNARTERPVRGAVVMLLGRRQESDAEGKFSFARVDYSDPITITVKALDYADETRTIVPDTEKLAVDIALAPLTNPRAEIERLLNRFSALIERVDLDLLEEIEVLFTEEYLASDDLMTRFFGLNTGVVPPNRDAVNPVFTALFEEFNVVQFRFHDIEMNVPHPRQASARLDIDIITEKGPRSVRREIISRCELYFRKEDSGWKIFFWQFLEADVRL
ncbi:MAG: nuclear transport factor 2 family protein [Candidatus Poribacteria bacterium]|nr:nuclear transport factor 2 family protein [Candidatus Poribacteria bacterium]MDE0506729.1 nuclear transport factor 2 family protein [Candidatus Poribacteria bacterium]